MAAMADALQAQLDGAEMTAAETAAELAFSADAPTAAQRLTLGADAPQAPETKAVLSGLEAALA